MSLAPMVPQPLDTLADELLAQAGSHSSLRSAQTLHGGHGHALRQTVIALVGGSGLDEHESPGEATLQVLRGEVRLVTAHETLACETGAYVVIPGERHSVQAEVDSVLLLTVAVPTVD